jgi:putative transposase
MQLIAGRTGQAYNNRKKRKGAFWEDRYHATAVARIAILCDVLCTLTSMRSGPVSSIIPPVATRGLP